MPWRRKKSEAVVYEEVIHSCSGCMENRVPKGYVPVLVGREDGVKERFLVRVSLLNDPCIGLLLDMAAREYGYRQEGILRIPCDVEQFRLVIDAISKPR
ncbi:auxin-responsive protein SAUR71-like [Elaeis guineensis]|uniref:auxin-responsive protein SAUR71-like n=1 Tax=Elaeis guineensis var. tenera TaxID=51953 RepID=UPI003C6D8280